MICPLCHNQNLITIGKPLITKEAVHLIRKEYKVVMCDDCQFYFVEPKIDLSIDEWSELYGKKYFSKLNEWQQKQRLKDIRIRFEKMVQNTVNGKINFLDIGCGEGHALIEAIQRHYNTFGIDISDNRMDRAKEKDITFSLGNLLSANYPENFFDCIHMDSVLEHLTNPVDYLKELNRIMQKNAVIYIGVPNEDSLFDNFRQLVFKFIGKSEFSAKIKPFATPFHVCGFTKKSLNIIANLANFRVIEIRNFATHFEYKKYAPTTKSFWIHFFSLPIDIVSIPLKMEKYYAIYLMKE